jgi:hypothetical protein
MSDGAGTAAASPMCPWCGDEVDDTPEALPWVGRTCWVQCTACGRPVDVERTARVSYRATKRVPVTEE